MNWNFEVESAPISGEEIDHCGFSCSRKQQREIKEKGIIYKYLDLAEKE